MNHIYRSIWNEKTRTFVAASEVAKSRGKKTSSKTAGKINHAVFILNRLTASLLLAFSAHTWALPEGGVVSAGSATISASKNNLSITQSSQNAAINWQSFSINQGQAVTFVQPNNNAVALNRVLGSDPSKILGNLNANGKVFLVNPNGILFGQSASINVGGLVASTLNITDANFLLGRYQFTGDSANAILNQGSINADGNYVALLGANISNQGVIAAKLGSVALAAGKNVTLDVAGDNLLNVAIDEGAVNALVENGGLIHADGGQILLTAKTAGNLLPAAVNNTGIIQAQTVENKNGTIKLLGDMHNGVVNVGGTLDASAPQKGHGGFIETSAAEVKIKDDVVITTAAKNGLTGSWLIDPTDYTVAATTGDITGAALGALLANTDIEIDSADGDVHVNDAVSWSANQLTLNAFSNISINAAMNGSGTASLSLLYGQGAAALGNNSTYSINAAVNLPAGNHFSTQLGSDGTLKTYTVINSLGVAGDSSSTTLQGVKNHLTTNYALGSNIDASATSAWNDGAGFTPIGDNTITNFSGVFDGLGHTISGLVINLQSSDTNEHGVGLFNLASTAVIKNLGLIDGNVTGYAHAGGLAGFNFGTISNSYNTGTVTVTGPDSVGGLVGYDRGIIDSSYTTGTVSGFHEVGGLVGLGYGTITNSYATGNISGNNRVGGLMGGGPASISNSYATGNISATGSESGGLVGHHGGNSTISDSYATGSVTSNANSVGGLVGSSDENNSLITRSYATGAVSGANYVGGLVGYHYNTSVITKSYASGAVSGNSSIGGLVGRNGGHWNTSPQITNSYATGNVTGTASYTGGLVGANYGLIKYSYATGAATAPTKVGGLIGYNDIGAASDVQYNYATGLVTRSSGNATYVGGLVGWNHNNGGINGTLSNSYWNSTVNSAWSGIGVDGAASTVTALTSAQMRTASNFSAFTFTTTAGELNKWVLLDTNGTLNNANSASGATFPLLASEYSTSINNAHQLQLMAMNVAATYSLAKNIDATATNGGDVWLGSSFIPIGNNNSKFTGTFNGQNYTISNLTINLPSSYYVGLFGYTNSAAVIKNVGLLGGSIAGSNYVGALVGYNNASTVNNSYATGAVSGVFSVGGLVGHNNQAGVISNSYASATVTGTNRYIGGLLGRNEYGAVSNSYATGSVGSGGYHIGGLVGINGGSGHVSSIENSYATGAVTGVSGIGGLVGTNASTVSNSYWNSTVASTGIGSNFGTATNVTGLTTAQMQQQLANFTGFDFTSASLVWGFSPVGSNNNYPVLCALQSCKSIVFVSPNSGSHIYGSTPSISNTLVDINNATYSLSNAAVSGTASYDTAPTSASNVGNYTFSYLSGLSLTGGGANNYLLAAWATPATWTVTQAPLTIIANNASKIYGAANPTFGVTYNGFVNNDTANSLTTQATATTTATAASNVGNYAITAAGAVDANYNIHYVAGSLTINPASLTVTANNSSKFYGAVNPSLGVTYNGFVNNDTANSLTTQATATTTATTASNAGNYAITASGAAGSNYNINYVDGSLTIDPASLTITANNASKFYGAVNPSFGVSYNGFVNNDTANSLTTQATATTAATTTSNAGNYAITASGAAGSNYNINYVAGSLTIDPASLTVTANNASKIYGAANPTFGVSYSGFVNNDTTNSLTTQATATTAATTASNAGHYAITASGAAGSNYSINYVDGSLTIDPASLTVTANNASKIYGAANPTFGVTYNGFVNNDTANSLTTQATATTAATAASNVGNYAITASGAANSNYNINYVDGSLTVDPASLTVTANNASKIYGAANPTFGISYSGFVNDEDINSLTTQAIATTTATTASNVGNYAITASGAVGSNYSINYVDGSLTIDPASLTVTANNASKNFGSENPVFSVRYSGFVNDDTLSSLTTKATATTSATTASKVGNYAITASGATASNYSINYVDGSFTINPAVQFNSAVGTATNVAVNIIPINSVQSSSTISSSFVKTTVPSVNKTAEPLSPVASNSSSGNVPESSPTTNIAPSAHTSVNLVPELNLTMIDFGIQLPSEATRSKK